MLGRLSIIVLLYVASLSASATDFNDLGKEISELRSSESARFFINFKNHTIELRKSVTSQIDSAAGEAVAKQRASLPILKLSDSGDWLEYSVDEDMAVMRPIKSKGEIDTNRPYQMQKMAVLKTFPDTEWPSFVEFAIRHGLAGFSLMRLDGQPASTMLFYPKSYRSINAGGKALVLTPQFNQLMGISRRFEGATGNRGFVILLHDPHENVAGRFQALSGLQQLLQANGPEKFQFLVEGQYDHPSRVIGLTGLAGKLPEGSAASAAVVHTLLARFVVNVPLAYRLLYARGLPAFSIDDNSELTYPAPGTPRSLDEQRRSLAALASSLESAPLPANRQREKVILKRLITLSVVYLEADYSEIGDEALVRYFATLATLLRDTSELATKMKSLGLSVVDSDMAAMLTDAACFDAEAVAYQHAYARNRTMSSEIIKHASGDSLISIAFIGSYHTQGLTAALRAAGIGYVVIEPHERSYATEAESKEFDRANLGNTRASFLNSLRLNMGYTSPIPTEVAQLAPQLRTLARNFDDQIVASQRGFAQIAGNKVDPERLVDAMSHNAGLSGASGAGHGAPPIPPRYSSAFAFFEPDREGNNHGGALLLLDPTDERWREKGRYDFLSLALFKAPERSRERAQSSLVLMYQDPETHRSYSTVFDPVSGRIYAFEGTPAQIAAFVPRPGGKDSKDGFIRIQVVEVDTQEEDGDV